MRPCVFFDRDGIANVAPSEEEYYVLSPDRFFIVPEFIESVKLARKAGYAVCLATNQKAVHRGLLAEETLEAIHAKLVRALADAGEQFDGLYCCPHNDGCPCRKPAPGMLLRAAEELDLDLSASWMIGDSPRDIAAGQAAGCRTILVLQPPVPEGCSPDFHVPDMSQLPALLKVRL